MVPVKTLSNTASPADVELQPILTGQSPVDRHQTRTARTKALLHDPVARTALHNLALILTWSVSGSMLYYTLCDVSTFVTYWNFFRYFFSTMLSLWNRKLVGTGHGVFGKGPFPGVVIIYLLTSADHAAPVCLV